MSDLFGDALAPDPPGDAAGDGSGGVGESFRVVVEGLASLERSGVVPRSTLERWLCEGTFQPVIIGPDDDRLHLGRKVRLANREQRRALAARDGGCGFLGCGVPASGCQPHHIVWWEHDGPTDIENLVLLCAFHHRLIHREGFLISRSGGEVRVHRPDGTPVTDAREVRCRPRRARPPPPDRDPDVDPDPVWLSDHRLARRRIDRLVSVACSRRTMDATVQGR